ASRPSSGYAATGFGIVLLLFGAMGLFGQLQDAMNTVWEVQPKPGRGWLGLLKDRLLSLSMVMGTIFLLLVSLVVSAGLGAVGSLVSVLIWAYYSAQIFLFGAEFTKVYADAYGSRIKPKPDAIPVTHEARAEQGIARTKERGQNDITPRKSF